MDKIRNPIIAFREQYGISQRKLAQILGVNTGTVKAWEAGDFAPSEKSLALGQALGLIPNKTVEAWHTWRKMLGDSQLRDLVANGSGHERLPGI